MTRVLHVIDHLGLGGAQSAVLDLIRCSDRACWDIEVAVMHGRGPFAEALAREGVTVHSLSANKWPPAYLRTFPRLAAEGGYRVLHFHLNGANWLAKTLAAAAGIKAVRIAHDHTSGNIRFRGWASVLPDALAHGCSHRVIAVSEDVRQFLLRYEALSPDRVVTIPNGVDTDFFRPFSAGEKRAARRRFGWPEDAWIAGSLGRLAPEKNYSLLVRLAEALPDALFVLGGNGPEGESLRRLIADLGLEQRFFLAGQVEARKEFYQALDAFVLPSLFEGLPMTVLEAMASGLPVVASRLGGIPSAISHEETGLLADPSHPAEFLGTLRVLREPILAARLGEAARRRVLDSFTARLTARRVQECYESLLAN